MGSLLWRSKSTVNDPENRRARARGSRGLTRAATAAGRLLYAVKTAPVETARRTEGRSSYISARGRWGVLS